MKRIIICLSLFTSLIISAPAWSALLPFLCDGPDEPKPQWVIVQDYSLPGYYTGIGSADREKRSKDEQISASEENAKSLLLQQIQVTVKAEIEQSTRVSGQKVQKEALSKVSIVAEEAMRGLSIKGRWLDKDSCTQYTLVVVSKESVAQSKQEKLMKGRLDQFKKLLAEGQDHEKNRDIKVRRKYLQDALELLAEIDFKFLPDEVAKAVYEKRVRDELDLLNKITSAVQGRMALFAINKDASLPTDVVGKMLDHLRSSDNTTDRLMAECIQEEDCISRAKERGFTMLTLLNTSVLITTSQMGALKGTLTVSKTVYDIDSRKVLKGPDTASAQVIGWSKEELDWATASEKIMQNLK